MKIKLIEFFFEDSSVSKKSIILLTILAGLFAGVFVFIINRTALVVYKNVTYEFPYILFFMTTTTILYLTKKESFIRSIKVTEELVRKKRVQLIHKIRNTDLDFLEKTGNSEIYVRLTDNINIISQSIPIFITSLDSLFTVAGVCIYCAFMSFESLICMLFYVLLTIIIFYSKYNQAQKIFAIADKKESEYSETLNGMLFGFKQIKVNHTKNDKLFEDITDIGRESETLKAEGIINIFLVSFFTDTLYFVMLGLFIFVFPFLFGLNQAILPNIIIAILFIYSPLSYIYKFAPHIVMSNLAIEKINKLEMQLDEVNIKYSQPEIILNDFNKIELSSASFSYIDQENQRTFKLGPVDLSIHKGDILFIVGGNGSGKSTLLKLLIGLYKTDDPGYILLDDTKLSIERYPEYGELFSIIFTDFHLFRKLYGIEHVDQNELNQLIQKMSLEKKTKYVNGKFTNIDLSTGQKKRLAYIAAIMEDKPIYIFDEWAADQDPEFREYFYTTIIQELRGSGKTVIAVTHDDRYFEYSDYLIKLDDGKIIERIDHSKHQ